MTQNAKEFKKLNTLARHKTNERGKKEQKEINKSTKQSKLT